MNKKAMCSDKIKIRPAEEYDKEKIIQILNNVFSENQRSEYTRDISYWKWKYQSDIYGKSILNVAEFENEIIGFDHLWPWQLKCRDNIIYALQPCDSVVKKEYRGLGTFRRLRIMGIEKAIANGFQLFFNFPNKKSLPVNLNIGAQYLGKITWWVKILKPINASLGFWGGKLATPSPIPEEYKLNKCSIELLEKEVAIFDHFISINRKPGFYDWRFLQKPHRDYGVISYETDNNIISAIFSLNQKGISREMILVDIIGDPRLSKFLFKNVIITAKKLEVSYVVLMDNHKFNTNNLWKLGFVKKNIKNMVVLPFDLAIENKVTKIENWSLVAGMHDSV